jgi:RNA polymerase sigma-70 factor (ECF subfamily)
MDESTTVEEAQKGSRESLNRLVADNYGIVKGYMLKITGDISLAQDITQEAMLKAVINIRKFDPRAKFSTWLITIATNIYRDYLRKNKRLEFTDEDIDAAVEGPEEAALNSIQAREAMDILKGLQYEKRAVFILKHYYGYKYEEIADMLKCPVGTVRSRLHYCVEYIRSEMKRRELI